MSYGFAPPRILGLQETDPIPHFKPAPKSIIYRKMMNDEIELNQFIFVRLALELCGILNIKANNKLLPTAVNVNELGCFLCRLVKVAQIPYDPAIFQLANIMLLNLYAGMHHEALYKALEIGEKTAVVVTCKLLIDVTLLLASKILDDRSMHNVDHQQITGFALQKINSVELGILLDLSWRVYYSDPKANLESTIKDKARLWDINGFPSYTDAFAKYLGYKQLVELQHVTPVTHEKSARRRRASLY